MIKKDTDKKKELIQKKIKRAKKIERELFDINDRMNELLKAEKKIKDELEINQIRRTLISKDDQ